MVFGLKVNYWKSCLVGVNVSMYHLCSCRWLVLFLIIWKEQFPLST